MSAITSNMIDIMDRKSKGELSEIEALALLVLEFVSENSKSEEVAL